MEQMSFNFNLEPQHRDYKQRNILTLEERIKVIREYEQNPIYQRIAEQFNCSSKQIKNIIANKELIIKFQSESREESSLNEARRRRHQKICFLGKVIYEYLLRAVYHGVAISANSIRQKAMQVSESIAIENFNPNSAWVQNFKMAYQIPEFELPILQKCITFYEPKNASFNCIDIIQYVSKCERDERNEKRANNKGPNEAGSNSNHNFGASISSKNLTMDQRSTVSSSGNSSNGSVRSTERPDDDTDDTSIPTVGYENNDISDFHEQSDPNCNSESSEPKEDDDIKPLNNKRRKSISSNLNKSDICDISSCEDALRYIQALEDFAMLQHNYRAVGLLTQLEDVFKSPPNMQDFDE